MRKPGDLVRIKRCVRDGAESFENHPVIQDWTSLPGRAGVIVGRDPSSTRGDAWYAVWLEGYEDIGAVEFSAHELRTVSR